LQTVCHRFNIYK